MQTARLHSTIGSYPLASSFYAVTRSDADENTLALLDWICSERGARADSKEQINATYG